MGCSSSKVTSSIIPSEPLSLDQVKALSVGKAITQSTRFLENCLVVWFCDETSNKSENEKEQLRKLVYGLKTFSNVEACIDFITNIEDEKIFLIISGTCQTVEHFQHLPQLEKIYTFDFSSYKLNYEKHRNLKHEIVRDIDTLYQQLQEDIKLCEMDFVLITVAFISSQEISFPLSLLKNNAAFLYTQMLKEIIYRLKFENGSKDVFVDFCRIHYINSSEQLRVVDDFAKNYRPNKALWWLTNQCFISKMLNRVQRTREIDINYKLGFFIKQVNLQLNCLHQENVSLMEKIPVVYRGKTMCCNEFDTLLKNNCGCLLSFPNFLITTTNKDTAIDFVDRRLAIHPDRMGIIFEIHIDHTIFSEKNPFALLKDIDMNKDEICFYMSTVFRIESLEQTTNDGRVIWFVQLKLINDDDQQLHHLIAPARSDDMHTNSASYLCKLLIGMGEYRRAEQFLLGLSQDPSVLIQPQRLVRVQNGLGAVYTYKSEYVKALYHYQQSLQTSLLYLKPDHPDLAPIYKTIGDSHLYQNDYIHAIENYEKAIELIQHSTQPVNSEFLTDLHTRVNEAKQLIESNK